MAADLKVSVRRQIDRLKKELAVATGQVAALRDQIKRHKLVYDMLDGRKTGKRSRQGRSGAGALKRGPRGAMIDWTGVFASLPEQFTLDSLFAHKTAGEKTRAYHRQVVTRWSKEGERQANWCSAAGESPAGRRRLATTSTPSHGQPLVRAEVKR